MFTLDNSGTNSYYLYALKTDTETEYFAQFTEGKYYWLLGNINTSSFDFLIDNPIFYYDGIRIISINTQIFGSGVNEGAEGIEESITEDHRTLREKWQDFHPLFSRPHRNLVGAETNSQREDYVPVVAAFLGLP